jgi:protein TonB
MQVKVGYSKVEENLPPGDPFYEPAFTFRMDEPVVEIHNQIAKTEPIVKRPPVKVVTAIIDLVPDDSVISNDTDVVTHVDLPVAKSIAPANPATIGIDITTSRNLNQVEFVPIFPGCESLGTNEEKKACMSSKISAFVGKRFRTDVFNNLNKNDVHRIYVHFKIDASGNVTDVIARAPHKDMQEEGIRVIEKLPQMTPGRMGDINVPVSYLVPIRFRVE